MKATLTVLGSGTSMGVPTIGCDCAVCQSQDIRDRRTRPSIMLEWDNTRVIIDSTPDFRQQALREGIHHLDAVFYTHGHADHILGLDDLRPLTFSRVTGGAKMPLYAQPGTANILRSVFKYIFDNNYKYGGIAQVEMHEVDGPFEFHGACIVPVPVMHGDVEITGYRLGNAAYLTDLSELPERSFALLRGLDVLFLDALRRKPHPTHSTVENSLAISREIGARQTYFTHISHDLPHQATNDSLPTNVQLSYDGLKLEFEI